MMEIIPNWHPIFVHFTVALLGIAVVLFILGVFNKNESTRQTMYKVAEWNFWIGSGITIATGLAGWYAYNTVAHDTPSHAYKHPDGQGHCHESLDDKPDEHHDHSKHKH